MIIILVVSSWQRGGNSNTSTVRLPFRTICHSAAVTSEATNHAKLTNHARRASDLTRFVHDVFDPTACVALETDQMRLRESVRPALTVFCTLSRGPLAVTNARGLQTENTGNGAFYKKTLDSKFSFR